MKLNEIQSNSMKRSIRCSENCRSRSASYFEQTVEVCKHFRGVPPVHYINWFNFVPLLECHKVHTSNLLSLLSSKHCSARFFACPNNSLARIVHNLKLFLLRIWLREMNAALSWKARLTAKWDRPGAWWERLVEEPHRFPKIWECGTSCEHLPEPGCETSLIWAKTGK